MFGRRGELVDEIARHPLLEPLAAAEDGHAPGVVREEDRRLAGRVGRADDVDVEAVGARRVAARRAVGDAVPGEPLEALDRQVAPDDAAREDDRPRPQDVAAVQVHLVGRRVDARDRPGHQDLRAQPARLTQRAIRQFLAGHARGEPEIVLDPRGRARLAAGRLALDDDGTQALGRSVNRRGQPGGSGADDHRVVLGRLGLGADVEQLGHPAELRAHHGLAVGDAADHGAILGRRQPAIPLLLRPLGLRRVRGQPADRDPVALEEAAQVGTGAIAPITDDDRPGRGRLGRQALQPVRAADPIARKLADRLRELGVLRGHAMVVVSVDLHHARLLRRAKPHREHGAQRDRHLPEDVASVAFADHALDPLGSHDRLDAAVQYREEGPLAPLVRRVLAGFEADVGRAPRKPLAGDRVERREDLDLPDLLGGNHRRPRYRAWCHWPALPPRACRIAVPSEAGDRRNPAGRPPGSGRGRMGHCASFAPTRDFEERTDVQPHSPRAQAGPGAGRHRSPRHRRSAGLGRRAADGLAQRQGTLSYTGTRQQRHRRRQQGVLATLSGWLLHRSRDPGVAVAELLGQLHHFRATGRLARAVPGVPRQPADLRRPGRRRRLRQPHEPALRGARGSGGRGVPGRRRRRRLLRRRRR